MSEVVVRAPSEVDVFTLPRLRLDLDAAIDAGGSTVVVDMAIVEFIDSAGLGVLVAARKRVQSIGGVLKVANVSDRVMTLLRLKGLDQVFPLVSLP